MTTLRNLVVIFLCTQDFKASSVKWFLVRACARLHARKTCFQRFGPNSLNFYRIKINFNVFWEPLENLKLWSHFCYSAMASFSVAGVFTYTRIFYFTSECIKELIFIGFEYLKVFLAQESPPEKFPHLMLKYWNNEVFKVWVSGKVYTEWVFWQVSFDIFDEDWRPLLRL